MSLSSYASGTMRRYGFAALVLTLLPLSLAAWSWNPMKWFEAEPASTAKSASATAVASADNQKGGCYNKSAEKHGAILTTPYGEIVLELFCDKAPETVTNFEKLVARDFYNQGMTWHRVVPGFVIQTGDPTGTGAGGSGKTIDLEINEALAHTGKGVVAMARSSDPDSATSQFYITLNKQEYLDGKYAVFGRVIKGLDYVSMVRQGDDLLGIRLADVANIEPEPETPPFYTLGYRMKNLVAPGQKASKQ